jgi:ElaB/YqjD/DUF883 family membrane-anchored ribosome-binding protein
MINTNNVQVNKEEVKDEVAELRANVATLTKQLAAISEKKWDEWKDKSKDLMSDLEKDVYILGQRLRNNLGEAQSSIKEGGYYIKAQAEQHPIVTLGIAFVIGILIGQMGSKRRD